MDAYAGEGTGQNFQCVVLLTLGLVGGQRGLQKLAETEEQLAAVDGPENLVVVRHRHATDMEAPPGPGSETSGSWSSKLFPGVRIGWLKKSPGGEGQGQTEAGPVIAMGRVAWEDELLSNSYVNQLGATVWIYDDGPGGTDLVSGHTYTTMSKYLNEFIEDATEKLTAGETVKGRIKAINLEKVLVHEAAKDEKALTDACCDELMTCAVAPHQVYGPRDNLFLPNMLETAGQVGLSWVPRSTDSATYQLRLRAARFLSSCRNAVSPLGLPLLAARLASCSSASASTTRCSAAGATRSRIAAASTTRAARTHCADVRVASSFSSSS